MADLGHSMQGRVALVTGAGRGAGRAIAVALAQHGADVAVNDLTASACRETAEAVQREGRKAVVVEGDVSQEAQVAFIVQRAVRALGRLDIHVNNAAIPGTHKAVWELTPQEWERVLNINLRAHFLFAREVVPHMKRAGKGAIVNIASVGAFTPIRGSGEYSVAKAGVVMLTKVLAQELGPLGIRVNAVAPGLILTEMARHVWENREHMETMKRTHPLGRGADPSEIAAAVAFLASDAASYVNGATLQLTGSPQGWG